MRRLSFALLLASASALLPSACGGENGSPSSLAVTICDRYVACGQRHVDARDGCVAATADELSSGLCPAGTQPTAGFFADCEQRVAAASCGQLDAGGVCPLPDCRAPDEAFDSPFSASAEGAAGGDGGGGVAPGTWFSGYEPAPLPPCGETPTIDGTIEVGLFRGEGIRNVDLAWHTRGLQRYFEPYDLWFTARGAPQAAPMTAALSGTEAELIAALRDAGVPLDDRELTPDEEERAMTAIYAVVFGPLRAHMRAHAMPADDRIDIVALDYVVAPDLAQLLDFEGVAGLGLSPTVLSRTTSGPSEGDLRLTDVLEIGADFTPTVFVAHTIVSTELSSPDVVLAHEIGHALGLVHEDDVDNLMYYSARTRACTPVLGQSQVDELVGVRRSALRTDAGVLTGPEFLERLDEGARRWLRSRRH